MKDWIPGEQLTVEDALILIKELKTLTVTHRLCKLGLSADQSAKLTVHAHETARRVESFLLDVKKAGERIGGEVLLTMYDCCEPVSNADAAKRDELAREYEEEMRWRESLTPEALEDYLDELDEQYRQGDMIITDHETIYI